MKQSSLLLGVPVGPGSLDEIVNRSMQAIDGSAPQATFACANAHSLIVSGQDTEFLEALRETTMVVADGSGVTMAGKILGIDVGPRITGSDFFTAVLDRLSDRGQGHVFFFGSSEEVLSRIKSRFCREYPRLTLCGALSPPFRLWSEAENQEMIKEINRAKPDVLWVGMTAPKQEKWVHANAARLKAPVIGSIGAVFDFCAGTVSRAPNWITKLGLEWIYRFAREPRRMWRRCFVSLPCFACKVIKRRILGDP